MFQVGERVLCIRNNDSKEFDKLIGEYGIVVTSANFFFGQIKVQFDLFERPVICDADEIVLASEDVFQYDIIS